MLDLLGRRTFPEGALSPKSAEGEVRLLAPVTREHANLGSAQGLHAFSARHWCPITMGPRTRRPLWFGALDWGSGSHGDRMAICGPTSGGGNGTNLRPRDYECPAPA